jgi:hypothetical protein
MCYYIINIIFIIITSILILSLFDIVSVSLNFYIFYVLGILVFACKRPILLVSTLKIIELLLLLLSILLTTLNSDNIDLTSLLFVRSFNFVRT